MVPYDSRNDGVRGMRVKIRMKKINYWLAHYDSHKDYMKNVRL